MRIDPVHYFFMELDYKDYQNHPHRPERYAIVRLISVKTASFIPAPKKQGAGCVFYIVFYLLLPLKPSN